MNNKTSFVLPVAAAAAVALFSSCKPSATPETAKETPKPTAAPSATPAAAATPAYVSDNGLGLKDPVATVNGEPISLAELDKAFNSAVESAGIKAADLKPEQKLEGYRQLTDDLIMEKLLTKAAEGQAVSDADVDAELAKIKGQFPSEEEFNKQLAEAGQSPDKLKTSIKQMLTQQKWMESKIGAQGEVTPEEVQKFYDENKAEFQEPETVKASHILFMVNKDDSEDVVKAKLAAAKKAATRAKKEDFTKLAKELSEEPGAKETGGDLGYFSKDRMVPEFAEAAFTQKVNTVGEPVRTQFGWHVIKVTDKKPAGTLPYDEVKDKLTAYLKTDKQRKAAQEVFKSLRDSAKIENTLPEPAPAPAMPMIPGAPGAAPAAGEPAAVPATEAPSQQP